MFDLNQTVAIIQSIFPAAEPSTPVTPQSNRPITYRIGRHYLILRISEPPRNVTKMEWVAGGRWVWNVTAAQCLDSFVPENANNTIGWLSYVWDCICNLSKHNIIRQIHPDNLLPKGDRPEMAREMLTTAIEVLFCCGQVEHEIIRYVADSLDLSWVFNKACSSALFYVKGSKQGMVVGRLEPDGVSHTQLVWGYSFHIGTQNVTRKGRIKFPNRGNNLDIVQKFLKRIYVQTILRNLNLFSKPTRQEAS